VTGGGKLRRLGRREADRAALDRLRHEAPAWNFGARPGGEEVLEMRIEPDLKIEIEQRSASDTATSSATAAHSGSESKSISR